METIEEKENNVLNRKEVKVIVEAPKSPGFDEAVSVICERFKCEKDNVAVKSIKGKFGRNTFLISSFIYKTKEDKERTEPKSKKKTQTQTAPKAEEKK